jgi:hypothetical protein
VKVPNLFVVGAPKCGTSTMHKWLQQHPRIYMSRVKDPNYFNVDHKIGLLASYDKYLKLFNKANDSHIYVGEASPYYLLSNQAVKNIEKVCKDAKYIVMLRNPIEMFISLVGQNRKYNDEGYADFDEIWRKSDMNVGFGEPYRRYSQICSIGEQLKILFNTVEHCKVFVVFLEDMDSDPERVWVDLQKFLDIDLYDLGHFSIENAAARPRFKILNDFFEWIGKFTMLNLNLGILTYLKQLNFVKSDSSYRTISDDLRAELKMYFHRDIQLLESLTDRDLSHWRF